jgi:hypothetical protein
VTSAARVPAHQRTAAPRRPELRPVPAAPRATARATSRSTSRASWRRLSPVTVAVSLVVASLLAVVGGNMLLASGQLRLQVAQGQLSSLESSDATAWLHELQLTSPAFVKESASREGLQEATPLILPVASLDHRLGPPTFSSAPCCSLKPGA